MKNILSRFAVESESTDELFDMKNEAEATREMLLGKIHSLTQFISRIDTELDTRGLYEFN